jgi:hypothetical protein
MALLRLDTRHDLVESHRLYAALGCEEVPAFKGGRYAEHRLSKPLASWLMAPKLHPVCRSLGDESRGHRGQAGRLAPDP